MSEPPPAEDAVPEFDPALIARLDRIVAPLKRLLSPVSFGIEHVPRRGAVLLAGNHTIYGVLDVPMLALELYEKTGRVVRALGDHFHFDLPIWRDVVERVGAVRGTRENCARLLDEGEAVLVFPGGGREVMKRKGEKYRLVWKERVGFARIAIEHQVPIVPFASVGVEDMFEIVIDADDVLASPLGGLLRALGVTEKEWFRHGEVIPPLSRGTGPAGLPRLERQYFLFGEPIRTERFAGRHDDPAACRALRQAVAAAIEGGIARLQEVRAGDPERYPVQRLLRWIASRLG